MKKSERGLCLTHLKMEEDYICIFNLNNSRSPYTSYNT